MIVFNCLYYKYDRKILWLFLIFAIIAGFDFVSFQRIDSIYAIVRSSSNPREFRIEYNDSSSRVYLTASRDTLLSLLLDVCHAAGRINRF